MRFVPGLERDVNGGYNFDREGEYLTDRLTDEAISIMEQFKEQHFFINLSYYTVHTPIEGKEELVEYYQKKLASGMSHQNAKYAAMVHSLDENIGKLMHQLDELNLADHTLVLFTSDNGGFINEWDGQMVTANTPLRSGKGALYEGGIRVPTIIRWPGITTPNTTSDYPITTQDFYPTLLEMVNLKGDSEASCSIRWHKFGANFEKSTGKNGATGNVLALSALLSYHRACERYPPGRLEIAGIFRGQSGGVIQFKRGCRGKE
jgi:arylsulfatase A-like enzyme